MILMSSRRSYSRHSCRISDDQMAQLVSKLQQLIPLEIRNRQPPHNSHRVAASKLLEETCNYIRELQREVHDLSHSLSELLDSMDGETAQAAIIRSLLLHS